MAWPLPSIRFSALFVLPVIVALAGCQGREHYAYQLDSIPVPGRIAMKKLSQPDCAISSVGLPKNIVLKSVEGDPEHKPDTAGATTGDQITGSKDKNVLRKKANLVDQLRWERDCYRNAERRARERLNSLQASTAVIVARLRNVKHDMQQPMRLHPPERPFAEVSQFEKRRQVRDVAVPSFKRRPEGRTEVPSVLAMDAYRRQTHRMEEILLFQ